MSVAEGVREREHSWARGPLRRQSEFLLLLTVTLHMTSGDVNGHSSGSPAAEANKPLNSRGGHAAAQERASQSSRTFTSKLNDCGVHALALNQGVKPRRRLKPKCQRLSIAK